MEHLNPYRAPENLGAAVEPESRGRANRAVVFSFVTAILGLAGAVNCAVTFVLIISDQSRPRQAVERLHANCWISAKVLVPLCFAGLICILRAKRTGLTYQRSIVANLVLNLVSLSALANSWLLSTLFFATTYLIGFRGLD